MMAKEAHLHSDMAHARQSDGINVIFDKKSPVSRSSRSRSSSSSRRSSDSSGHRGRTHYRRRNRSSSSSRSSSPRSRSRSYPRCHRPSSRCRCADHRRYGRGRHHRSPPRRYRAHSRTYSRSPSYDRYLHKSNRSRSRSSGRRSRRPESHFRHRASPHRSRSGSRSSGQSVSLSVHDKKKLLKAAKDNAVKILGVEKSDLPESVEPMLSEQTTESTQLSSEPVVRVRPSPKKTSSQSEEEPDDMSSPSLSPKYKMISFSINNSVAKPTVAAPPCAKVTSRVDSFGSRKPYGHWIPVRRGQTSRAHKHKSQ